MQNTYTVQHQTLRSNRKDDEQNGEILYDKRIALKNLNRTGANFNASKKKMSCEDLDMVETSPTQ